FIYFIVSLHVPLRYLVEHQSPFIPFKNSKKYPFPALYLSRGTSEGEGYCRGSKGASRLNGTASLPTCRPIPEHVLYYFPNRDAAVRESVFGRTGKQQEGAMAQTPPIVKDGLLTYPLGGSSAQVEVDSSDWYTWLETASSFAFRSAEGLFTARKE